MSHLRRFPRQPSDRPRTHRRSPRQLRSGSSRVQRPRRRRPRGRPRYRCPRGPRRHQASLHLRRRTGRRRRLHEDPAGRQGRQPRGDEPNRPLRPRGIHRHHRDVRRVPRKRRRAPGWLLGRDARGTRLRGEVHGEEAGRRVQPLAPLRPLRRGGLHARHDGHRAQPRTQRRRRRGLAAKAGEKFAFDSYRRFLDMYGDVVMGSSTTCSSTRSTR